MKRLNCLIISFIFAGSLLSGIWLIGLSVSDEGVTLFFEPETVNVEPSQVFTVNVWVANVKNLYKWTLSLRWDAKVIELEPISSSAVTEGSFLKNVGRTRLTVLPYTAGSGYLSSISCELTQPISASGSGVLFSIRFKAKTNGDTPIAIESSVLYNYYKQIIPHSYKNGYVSVTSVIHDVAISLEGPATCVLGETNLLNVTIANLGQVDERNVLLKILINSKVWQEKTLTLLQRGTAEKLSFLWKPGNAGAFNITAYIVPHPYESNTANNQISLMVNVVELVHDVAIWLKVPNRIVLGENVMLNATIINVGGYDEANIDVLILINGEIVKSETINFLNVGSQRILTLQWQPAEDGIYNITGYVKPVANEFNVVNNLKSLFVKVSHTTQPKILIVSSDKGSYFVRGTSLPEFQFAVESAGYSYDIWIKSVNGRPTLERLLDYDVVIWTCGDFSSKALDKGDAEILERYLNAGGNIIIEGENVCENNPDSYSNLWRSVIHVTGYLGPNNAPGLTVIDTKHLIVQGLPTNLNWTIKPRSPDSVKASYGAYAILKYTNYEYAAAVVFDGGLVGIGSVVYFSFPIYCIAQNQINLLVANSIRWLIQFSVSRVIGGILYAPKNTAYFVYPETVNGNINSGIIAGSMLYALCQNPQQQGFATTNFWFTEEGRVNMTWMKKGTIGMFGNPFCHRSVKYYEDSGLTPVKMDRNSTHYLFVNRTRIVIASLSLNAVTSGHEDMFVIYVFKDSDIDFLVMYGLSWKGEWACCTYFADVIVKNLASYFGTFFIFKWSDVNGDGVPQPFEIEIVAQG